MDPSTHGPDTVIILSRDQASFYEFLKPRQEAKGGTLVVLERRVAERRTNGTRPVTPERRKGQRRSTPPQAALALMSVLGFMILHRNGERWTS